MSGKCFLIFAKDVKGSHQLSVSGLPLFEVESEIWAILYCHGWSL